MYSGPTFTSRMSFFGATVRHASTAQCDRRKFGFMPQLRNMRKYMTQTARQAVVAPSSLPSFICDPNPRAIDLAVGLSRTLVVTVRPSLRAASAHAAHTLMWITSLETTYTASSPLMHLSHMIIGLVCLSLLSIILISYFKSPHSLYKNLRPYQVGDNPSTEVIAL